MGCHQGLVQIVLHGQRPEESLSDHEENGADGGEQKAALGAQATDGEYGEGDQQNSDQAGERAVAVLDHRVEVHARHHLALAEGPAVQPRSGGTAAQARVGHAHDAAHDHEEVGRDHRREREAAECRGGGAHVPVATGCATVPSGSAALVTSRRMSFIGSTDRIRGTTSKLFSGGGDEVNHSSVLAFHGSLPALRPPFTLMITFTTVTSTPMPRMNDPIVETRFMVLHSGECS